MGTTLTSPQTLDGIHDCMLSPASLDQTPSDRYSSAWTAGQESGYLSRWSEPFVHTQHQRYTQAYGLPSPAPTAPAASPPDWPNHDVSSIIGGWGPASPMSPPVGEGVSGACNSELEMMLYGLGTLPPSTFDAAQQEWAGHTGFGVTFSHPYAGVPAAPSIPPEASPDFSTLWTDASPETALSNEPLLNTPLSHAFAPSAPGGLNNVPQDCHPTQCLNRSSSSLDKRPPPRPQQRRIEPPSPLTSKATVEATTKDPTSPLPSHKLNRNHKHKTIKTKRESAASTATATVTLRTAARRVKRPSPAPKPGESPERQRARSNHNIVEQHYRHRLHARFEALLEVLPEALLEGDDRLEEVAADGICGMNEEEGGVVVGCGIAGSGAGANGTRRAGGRSGITVAGPKGKHRRMSKVDVLSRATKAIRFLEGDIERARREVEGLRRERGVWLLGRGGCAGLEGGPTTVWAAAGQ